LLERNVIFFLSTARWEWESDYDFDFDDDDDDYEGEIRSSSFSPKLAEGKEGDAISFSQTSQMGRNVFEIKETSRKLFFSPSWPAGRLAQEDEGRRRWPPIS